MWLFGIREEKLGAICVGSIVGHGDHSSHIVLQYEISEENKSYSVIDPQMDNVRVKTSQRKYSLLNAH